MLEQIIPIIPNTVWYVAIGVPIVLAFVHIWFQLPSKGAWTSGEGDRSDLALSKAESLFFFVVVLAVLASQVAYYAGGKSEAFKFVESPVFEFGWTFVGQYLSALTLFRTDWDRCVIGAVLVTAALLIFVVLWSIFAPTPLPGCLRIAFKVIAAIVSVLLLVFKLPGWLKRI